MVAHDAEEENKESACQQGDEIHQLGSRGTAVLDLCRRLNIAGRTWLDMYIWRTFGNNDQVKSEGKYIIPLEINGMKVRITLDVVASGIPLHMSKATMERVGINLNYKATISQH